MKFLVYAIYTVSQEKKQDSDNLKEICCLTWNLNLIFSAAD